MGKERKRNKKGRIRRILMIQFLLLLILMGCGAFYLIKTYGEDISAMQQEARRIVDSASPKTFRAAETSLVYDDNGNLITAMKGE